MRSLYVDDIQGTKPKRTIYNKSLFKMQHQQKMKREARNPEQKRVFQWYKPLKRSTEPLDRTDNGMWRTKKSLENGFSVFDLFEKKNSSTSFNKSKDQQINSSRLNRSSVLSGTGQNSLTTSQVQGDPYFPHRYAQPQTGQTNRWTGNRSWMQEPTSYLNLPSGKDSYYPRWK